MIGQASSTPARRLGVAAAGTRWANLSDEVKRQALDFIIDTFAVMAAGAAHTSLHPAASRLKGEAGPCTVVGYAGGASANTAALLNGATTTVLQLQDGHRVARGHPMSHVLPAALAVAEERDASPEAFLSAVVAGYEVSARVGRALGGLQDLLHDTGTFGTIGAAVATAFLVSDANADTIAEAIEGSASVTLFPYRETPIAGATVHHLYVGLGASIGITAGKAATFGLSSLSGTLENFFGPRAGADFRLDQLSAGIDPGGTWQSYELMQAYMKVHPTCAHLNGINDAVLELIGRGAIAADAIEAVDVASYGIALDYNIAEPANDLSARFSIPYAVAIALVNGPLGPKSINEATLAKREIRDLAGRVRVRHDPEMDKGYPAGRPARVAVTMKDGTVHRADASIPRGDVANPLTTEERREKAVALFDAGLGTGKASGIIAEIEKLAGMGSLKDLGAALRSSF